MVEVKICGVRTKEVVEVAILSHADYIGFMFYPQSPRFIPLDKARGLSALTKSSRTKNVAIMVDGDDDFIQQIIDAIKPDMLQAHGQESPQRIADIKARFGLPIIKALAVEKAQDIARADDYAIADMILFDTKTSQKGGSGEAFDWRLLAQKKLPPSWILAGGLNKDNIAQAVQMTQAARVDVSSGVESALGVKDPLLVKDFLSRAKQL